MNNAFDRAAMKILLTSKNATEEKARLSRLTAKAKRATDLTYACPECGSEEPKQHNGSHIDPTLLCEECGEQFDEPDIDLDDA